MKKEDKKLLIIIHLVQLLYPVALFGGFIAVIIIWLTKKDEIIDLEEHGKHIINFQLSMLIYLGISCLFIIVFCLGTIGVIFFGIMCIICPIINAIRASNGEMPSYPLSIKFIK